MFGKTIFSYTCLIGGVIGGWLFFNLHITEKDKKLFKELQEKGRAIAQASELSTTQQNRIGVRKDLWVTQVDGKRLHDRIESESSTLTLIPVNDHLDIVENLNQIRCSMQDRVFDQNGKLFQQIRHFDATSGIYRYSTNSFNAKTVSLALFRLPGADLPLSLSRSAPYLKGVAQDVSFAVAGKASQFQAKQFKATFNEQKEGTP